MPYKLIKGEFHIHYPHLPRNGPQPDGDTLKFLPDNPLLVADLETTGDPPRFNSLNMINLRFEGIDALETHFGQAHQNLQWANAARDFVLDVVGFENVKFWDDLPHVVESVDQHPQRGYVLAKTIDGHGRIIAFVYTGESTLVDGASVWLDPDEVAQSINAQLMDAGLVYPLFYTTMPINLKDRLAEIAKSARSANKGLWTEAVMTPSKPATIPNIQVLQDLVIFPKFFRRMISFFGSGHTSLEQLDMWLRQDPKHRDDFVLLPNREIANMHDLIEVDGDTIRMLYQPEDLIILPDDAVVVVTPPPTLPSRVGDVRILAALVNPKGADRGDETVTLLNTTPDAIDLTNWTIADKANNRQTLDGDLAGGGIRQVQLSARVSLNNTGDTITLFDATDKQIDQVSYRREAVQEQGRTLVF